MTAKEAAVLVLTLNHMGYSDPKAGKSLEHPLFGEFSKEEFHLFLYLYKKEYNKSTTEQVSAFVDGKALKKFQGWGYITIEQVQIHKYYILTDKGRKYTESLLVRLMANYENIDTIFNFKNLMKKQ